MPDGDAATLLSDPAALRQAFERHGLAVLRKLLSPRLVGDAADQLRAALGTGRAEPHGPARRAELDEPPGRGQPPGEPLDVDPAHYRALFSLRVLHELPHAPPLRAAMSLLLEDEELVTHPRPAVRAVPPAGRSRLAATPAHQDHLGMQGSAQALVGWIPLTDCPLELGPIAVAAGSHGQGLRPYRPLPGARVLACDDAGLESSWRAQSLAAGDVVVFHALSVHRALPNTTQRWRLSLDFRCQRVREPICELSVRDDPAQPFDVLYATWPADSPALAWRRLELRLVPFDASVLAGGQRPEAPASR